MCSVTLLFHPSLLFFCFYLPCSSTPFPPVSLRSVVMHGWLEHGDRSTGPTEAVQIRILISVCVCVDWSVHKCLFAHLSSTICKKQTARARMCECVCQLCVCVCVCVCRHLSVFARLRNTLRCGRWTKSMWCVFLEVCESDIQSSGDRGMCDYYCSVLIKPYPAVHACVSVSLSLCG